MKPVPFQRPTNVRLSTVKRSQFHIKDPKILSSITVK
jgi:hypothetical protein